MKLSIISIFILLFVNSSMGIATSNVSVSENNPSNISDFSSFDWDYIYSFKGSSGIAIHSNWLLTAGHVADDLEDGT